MTAQTVLVEAQANAWVDDESESGAQRVRLVHGDMVRVPFDPGKTTVSTTGGGTATYNSILVGSNPDGSSSGYALSLPVVAAGSPPYASVRLFVPFYGSTFGIRWRRDTQTTIASLTVVVDGEAVNVDTSYPPAYPGSMGFNVVDNDAQATMTHAQLKGKGPHMAEIIAYGPNTGSTTAIMLHGLLCDRGAGYQELPRLGAFGPSVSLTTSNVEVGTNRGNAQNAARSIRSIIYYNTSASPVAVFVNNVATDIWSTTVPANGSAIFDPGMPFTPNVLVKQRAATGAVVTATAVLVN